MADRLPARPTADEIAEWELDVIALPVVPGTERWGFALDMGSCDYCGDDPVVPKRACGSYYDGDPALCVTCGSVFAVRGDVEIPAHLSDAYAVLAEDDHARLFDLLAGEVSDE